MNRVATLSTTVNVYWCDRNRDLEAEVEVDYTYNGEDLNIINTRPLTSTDSIGDDDFDDQVWEAVTDLADEAYAEWEADYGEYLRDAAEDRRAA